jgi:hypothetical protein
LNALAEDQEVLLFAAIAMQPLRGELVLDGLEQGSLEQRGLWSAQDLVLELDLTDIEAIAQHVEEGGLGEGNPAAGRAGREVPDLGAKPSIPEVSNQPVDACPYRKSNPLAVDRESGDAAVQCWICAN